MVFDLLRRILHLVSLWCEMHWSREQFVAGPGIEISHEITASGEVIEFSFFGG
jgi:hypothetical protein